MKHLISTLFGIMAVTLCAWGQDDMLKQLEQNNTAEGTTVTGTFKGTRLINGHSIETREKGNLDFIISHRFGRLNSGAYSLFGLDDSNIRLGLESAVTEQLTWRSGRKSLSKVYDGFIRNNLREQEKDHRTIPIC